MLCTLIPDKRPMEVQNGIASSIKKKLLGTLQILFHSPNTPVKKLKRQFEIHAYVMVKRRENINLEAYKRQKKKRYK